MAKYDPFWIQKLRAKEYAKQERQLSHILVERKEGVHHTPALCGRGWGAKGYPSITHVMFPSINNLPGCRTCREIFLKSLGVDIDPTNGYPLKAAI